MKKFQGKILLPLPEKSQVVRLTFVLGLSPSLISSDQFPIESPFVGARLSTFFAFVFVR